MLEVTGYSFVFSKDSEPEVKVDPNTEVRFKTLDCFCNQFNTDDKLTFDDIDMERVNPGTGPVYINGAEPGDVIAVHINDIQIADGGVAVSLGMGPMAETSEAKIISPEIKDGMVQFNDIEIPIDPMIGVIGVAPKGEDVPCGMWGLHGGNMDNKKIVKGTTVYLPVNVEGALLQIGDLHAVMGDGELTGAGLEIAGSVDVKIELIKDFELNMPLLKTEDKWYTNANSPDFKEAQQIAVLEMQRLVTEAYGWDETDTAIYFSLQGDIEICQSTEPDPWDITLRFGIPVLEGKDLI